MIATRRNANDLMLRGSIALSRVEAAGIRIDVPYLEKTNADITARVKNLTADLRNDKIYARMRKRYGEKTKIGSREQLGQVLFGDMKVPGGRPTAASRGTKKERYQCDEEILATVDIPFVKKWLECEELKRTNATFIGGIMREVCDGFLHPVQNLHLARTYRPSVDHPNGQNWPARDEGMAKLVRTAIIPRRGRVFVEVDFKGAEVGTGACYHKDPNMLEYIRSDAGKMHLDMAAQIFCMRVEKVPKPCRQLIKAAFVFAEFYGSWYKNCAPSIWKQAQPEWLAHLERKTGIRELGECKLPKNGEFFDPEPGTFEHHLAAIEKDFWGRRFRGYAEWKRQWYADYVGRGYFDMLTGFRCSGVFSKNEAVNYPIQGAAFHCLLWALIELNDWLQRHRMKSLIVGQIHDSMQLDCVEDELEAVLVRVTRIITKDLPRAWPWLIIPLSVEIEGSRQNWYEKRPLAI